MAKIRILNENVIGKIAAGEVVERPAAAIKELIENSLDAGATAITVETTDGGMTSIRVSDNGCGIDENDIRLAFERHATSKIVTEKDLETVGTLGFRGEALASIVAVGKVTMITRTAERDTGLEVKNEGGKILSIKEKGCPVGTSMIVKDLFYNVPVRRGFLKKAHIEAAAISDVVSHMILSRPDVSFRYVSNEKTVFHSAGDGRLLSALCTVFGVQASKTFRHVEGHANGLVIDGYVGIGDNARGNRGNEIFFINGRVMQSAVLSLALEDACRERVMIGKYPVCAIHIKIAYEAVDVNVHPNKLIVRFRDENAVREAVMMLVRDALRDPDAFEKPVQFNLVREKDGHAELPEKKNELFPAQEREPLASVSTAAVIPDDARSVAKDVKHKEPVLCEDRLYFQNKYDLKETGFTPPESDQTVPETEKTKTEAETRTDFSPGAAGMATEEEQISMPIGQAEKQMRVLGALFHTYILVECEDQLFMIDQHAVHERLLFDRFSEECKNGRAGQELLMPVILNMTRRELAVLEENQDLLRSIGMIAEPFGEDSVAVRTIPMILGETQTDAFIREAISDLESGKTSGDERKRSALLQTACKHAVKGGDPLPEDLLRGLVEEMLEKKVTPTCPHGRPLVVAITRRELDRKFKRIQ